MRPVVKEIEQINNNAKIIIDYNNTDFRIFWKGNVEEILHKQEYKLIQKISFRSGGCFLDLGCGHGRLIPAYYQKDRQIICVDYALNHLQMAAQTYPFKNITYIAADANHLPFRNHLFSGGISVRLFHHIASDKHFIKEISRVFNHQATLFISYMNCRNLLRMIRFGKQCFRKGHMQIADVLFATHPAYIKNQLKNHQWKIIHNSGAGLLYQLATITAKIEQLISINKGFYRCFEIMDNFFSFILGKLNLGLMQYLQVINYDSVNIPEVNESLAQMFQCPKCQATSLDIFPHEIRCKACETQYPVIEGIIDFRI